MREDLEDYLSVGSSSRRNDVQYVATSRRKNAPAIDVPRNSLVIVKISDGSEVSGCTEVYGRHVWPKSILHPHFHIETLVFIRMPDGRSLSAELGEPKQPTRQVHIIKPTSITVYFQDDSSKNALLQLRDRTDIYKLLHCEGTETRAFVGRSSGYIYTGFFRQKY